MAASLMYRQNPEVSAGRAYVEAFAGSRRPRRFAKYQLSGQPIIYSERMNNGRKGSAAKARWQSGIMDRGAPPHGWNAKGHVLAAAAAILTAVPAGNAADEPRETSVASLDPVVVISTRSPRPASEVVGKVSVLGEREIDGQLVLEQEDLWRYLPGIEVESSGARFSGRSLNIRGIGGNRVVMELDGIPVQDRFLVGSFADAARSGTEAGFIHNIEVLRGPASSLYGSKAIGGVVAVSTFDPEHLAGPAGAGWGGRLRGGHSGASDTASLSALLAHQGSRLGLLLGGSHRQGHAPDRSADPDNADRVDQDRDAMLAKMTLKGEGDARLRLTVDADEATSRSEMHSLTGRGRFINTTSLTGDDRTTRAGIALDGQLSHGPLETHAAVYHRETRSRQDTTDLRELAMRPTRVDREFRYDTWITGARARGSREFQWRGYGHRLMAGADFAQSRREESRDGSETGLEDGIVSKVVLGESFPLRDFPKTLSDEAGLFVQDEIDTPGGRWTFIPALRFDWTRIEVREDELWRQANPSVRVAELIEHDLSPRLGLLWRLSPDWQAWAQYAHGFRAPPAEDLNIGLDIPLFNVRAIPNPDLRSETSDGIEVGVRVGRRHARFSLAGFWTHYEDFIVSRAPLGPDPDTGTLLFQSQNLDRTRIYGVEAEAAMPLAPLGAQFEGFEFAVSGYWARGEDRSTGRRLDDVGPPSMVLHLHWSSADGHWSSRLSGTFTRGQRRAGSEDAFPVPGYGLLDLVAAWRPSERLRLQAGIFNLADKTWWRWGDVRHLPATDPLVPALSGPGRSLSVTVSLGFGPGHH
jgi:hemoglobin/transferrin/lactoferrin receptor protein